MLTTWWILPVRKGVDYNFISAPSLGSPAWFRHMAVTLFVLPRICLQRKLQSPWRPGSWKVAKHGEQSVCGGGASRNANLLPLQEPESCWENTDKAKSKLTRSCFVSYPGEPPLGWFSVHPSLVFFHASQNICLKIIANIYQTLVTCQVLS